MTTFSTVMFFRSGWRGDAASEATKLELVVISKNEAQFLAFSEGNEFYRTKAI